MSLISLLKIGKPLLKVPGARWTVDTLGVRSLYDRRICLGCVSFDGWWLSRRN